MKNLLGLTLGLIIGYSSLILAQTIYLVDPANTICWTQAGALAEMNTWKYRVTYNTLAPEDVTAVCSSSGGQNDCKLTTPIPVALQVTPLTVKIEAAALNPDGTATAYSILVTSSLSFRNNTPPPPTNSGSNLRVVTR